MSNFVTITKQEFENFIPDQNFQEVNDPKSQEYIYEYSTKNPKLNIRIYSSVDKRSQESRSLGSDAIRCVLMCNTSKKPLDKGKRTHRMENWRIKLLEKLDELQKDIKTIKFCKTCGSAMTLRKSDSGEFWGCLRYPICTTLLTLNGQYRESVQNQEDPVGNSTIGRKVVKCPKCGAEMRKRSGKWGEFYGCTKFFSGCKGTRKVQDVDIYGQGVEEEREEKINEQSESKRLSNTMKTFAENETVDVPEDDSHIELIETKKFPHMSFKFDKFNPVQSRVFKYYDQDINLIVAAATSAGKTTIAEMLMSHSISQGKKAVFLSPLKAVSQEKYDDWRDENHNWSKLNVSIVTGDYSLTAKRVEELQKAHVIVMTNEMMDSRTRRIKTERNDWLLDVGTIVMDECFLGGTPVLIEKNVCAKIEEIFNNKKIKYVLSYNEKRKKLEKRKIVRRIKKRLTSQIVSITYKIDGEKFNLSCTPNHKIWTNNGYKRADQLEKGDELKIFPTVEDNQCTICKKAFRTRTLFLKHFFKEHVRYEKFICNDCVKEFKRKNELTHHKNYVHKNQKFVCNKCKRKFRNKKSLESHKMQVHYVDRYNCKFCKAFFAEKKYLKSHIRFEHKFFDLGKKNEKKILKYNKTDELQELWTESKNIKISKLERKVIKLNKQDLIYTGNHSFWLTLGIFKNGKIWKKNPDFKVKGQRKIIEVGDITYWHSTKEVKQTIKAYKKINYECLYLINDDFEDKNWNNTVERIETFISNHTGIVENVKKWGSQDTKNVYVYNLEVEGNHNYIAKNVLVSNCHLLTMVGRGDRAESAMMRFSKQNPKCRIVFLSATMPNVSELSKWLSSLNNKKTELINSNYRPCQLDIHYLPYNDYGRYADKENNKIQEVVRITQQYPNDKFIIFVHSKATGRTIFNTLKSKENIEIHNAELSLFDRIRISEAFKGKGKLRIIVATSTLAYGINLPARRVIVAGVHRGLSEVEPLDIKQEVGRAGRVGFDPKGDAYILLPKREFHHYQRWCEDIPPITSTMNNPGTLAFHIVSEISDGDVYDVKSLMEWYNRSLAAFQNDFLDRLEAEELLEGLVKISILEKHENRYEITKLGRVAAHLYFSPYTIAGWYFNFNKVFSNNYDEDDLHISWAMANIKDNMDNFIPKEFKEEVKDYKFRCTRKGLQTTDGTGWIGFLFEACLKNFEIGEIHKKTVKYDIERMLSAIDMIDNRYASWKKKDYWNRLGIRINYEVSWEQTELCTLKGIGGAYVRRLFDNDVKSIRDLKLNVGGAIEALGKKLYNKVLQENNL